MNTLLLKLRESSTIPCVRMVGSSLIVPNLPPFRNVAGNHHILACSHGNILFSNYTYFNARIDGPYNLDEAARRKCLLCTSTQFDYSKFIEVVVGWQHSSFEDKELRVNTNDFNLECIMDRSLLALKCLNRNMTRILEIWR